MAKLADLFVSLRGDDRPLNETAAKARATLTGLDRTKVEPRITLPDVTPQVNALQSKLQALSRTKVRLGVDASLATAEVKTLERQLETLQTRRTAIPLELREDIDAEIAEVERTLGAATRRQRTIPLRLERITDQVTALQTQVAAASGDGVEIPVQLTGLAAVRARVAGFVRDRHDLTIDVSATTGGGGAFDPSALLKIPALLAAVNVAGSAVSSLAAGAISLTAAMAPAVGAIAALPVGMLAVGQASGVARLALSGVEEAMTAQDDMARKVASGVKITAAEQQKYNQTLKDAGPAAVGFASQLLTAQNGLGGVRRAVQNALLPQLGRSIADLSGTYLPVLQTQLGGTATVLADLARRFTQMATGQAWAKDIGTVLAGNNRLLATFGGVALDAADILLMMWVRALPMTQRFATWLGVAVGKLRDLVQEGYLGEGLTTFFRTAGDTAAQLGRIVGGLAVGLFRVFQGGYSQGKSFLDLFESLTARFAAWTGTLQGQNAISDFFARARPVMAEVGRLVADVARGFATMSTQTGLAPIIAQVRTELLPALGSIVTATSSKLLPSLVSLATRAAEFFNVMSGHSGSLVITIDILTRFADTALYLLNNVPGATTALGAFFAVMAVRQAGTIIASVTGLTGLGAAILGVKTQAGPATAAIVSLATAQGRATAAANIQAIAARVLAAGTAVASVAMRAAGVAVRFMLGPIGLVITAIGLLVAGLVYAYKNSETFRAVVDAVWAGVKRVILAVVTWIRTEVPAVFTAVKNWVIGAWTAISTGTVSAWAAVRTAVANAWAGITGFFSAAGRTILAPVLALWNAVKTGTSTVLTAVGGVIRTVVGGWWTVMKIALAVIATGVYLVWKGIQTVASAAFNFVKDRIIAPVWNSIQTIFTTAHRLLSTAWSAFWNAHKAVASAAWTYVKDRIITPVWTAISTIFSAAQRALATAWSRFWTTHKAVASAAWTFVKDRIITPVWTAISTIFTTAQRALNDAWTKFWTANKAIVSAAWTYVRDRILTPVWTAIKTAWTTAQTWVSGKWTGFWTAIKTAASTAWTYVKVNILDATWAKIKTAWTTAQTWVSGKWSGFWTAVKSTGKSALDWVKGYVDTIWGRIKSATSTFVTTVGRVFDGIKAKFAAPVNWVVDNVFSKIRSVYNKIAGMIGAKEIPALGGGGPVNPAGSGRNQGRNSAQSSGPGRADGGPIPEPERRADGGPIRGRGGPRQDNIAGVDRRTRLQTAWVSAKEFVTNALQYRRNKKAVETINRGGQWDVVPKHGPLRDGPLSRALGGPIPRLFLGGTAPTQVGRVSRHTSGYGWARWAGDINGPGDDLGNPVRAWKDGVVAAVQSLTTSYGKHIKINHGGERSLYAHLSRLGVNVGQRVSAGQTIGNLGSTGNSSGPHLHFEVAGGSSPLGRIGDSVKESIQNLINPRALFGKAVGGLLNNIGGRIPDGTTPLGRLLAGMARTLLGAAKSKFPESYGQPAGSASSSPTGIGRLGPRAAAARKYVIDRWGITNIGGYANRNIAGTNTPSKHSLGKAIDVMTYKGSGIADYFAGPGRGKFGVDNVIWQKRIHNSRGWHGYNGIPHNNHVHVDFFKGGGEVGLAQGALIRGGRGGVSARIGEGARDELVTPLPRNWRAGGRDDKLDQLIAAIEANGLSGHTFQFGDVINPREETVSQTTNRVLQRVASLPMV